jgi:hypothetical protein
MAKVNKDRTELRIQGRRFPMKKRPDGFSEVVLVGGVWLSIETLFEYGFVLEEAEKLNPDTDTPKKPWYSGIRIKKRLTSLLRRVGIVL